MMCGWLSAAAVRASRLKRSTIPSPMSSRAGARTLIATLRSSARSWARNTVAIPPRPSSARISYSPSVACRRASIWALCSTRRTGGATVAPAPPVVTGTLVPQRRQKKAPGAREVPQREQYDWVSGAIDRGLSNGPLNNTWAPAGQLVVARRFPVLAEHGRQRRVAFQDRLDVRDRRGGHPAARLVRGAADVRQQHGARRGTQPGVNGRLLEIDVEACPTQPALLEGLRERFLADQITARRIDQDGARLHLPQRVGVDDAFGLRHRRRMERQHVAFLEKRRPPDPHRAGLPLEVGPRVARGVENTHAEWDRAAPHRLADPSGAEQAEGAAPQLEPEQQLRMPTGPRPARHERGPGDYLAGAREDQRPSEVGGGVGEDVGCVSDRDAAHLRRHDVHVVVPGGGDAPRHGHSH